MRQKGLILITLLTLSLPFNSLFAGYLTENIRFGIDSYSFHYQLTQMTPTKTSNNRLTTFDTFTIEYDARSNFFGEAKFSMGQFTKPGSQAQVGGGYHISPAVSLGGKLTIAHQMETIEKKNEQEGSSSNFDLLLNPYSRMIFKFNSRTHLYMQPGVLFAYIRSANKNSAFSGSSQLYEENRSFPLVTTYDEGNSATSQSEGYLGFGMNMLSSIHVELTRDIFYRGSVGFGLITGRTNISENDKDTSRELTHFSMQINFAQFIYQF